MKLGEIAAQIAMHANDHPPAEGIDIVSTIQVPRRFNDLTKNLPPSRYDAPSGMGGGSGGAPPTDGGAGPLKARPHLPGGVPPSGWSLSPGRQKYRSCCTMCSRRHSRVITRVVVRATTCTCGT